MKLRLLLLSLCMGMMLPAFAQIDVSALTADTKTFIFDDDKNTVKNYIYQEFEAKTSCCGAARIYLEVKIAPSGYVLSAKTLTGKNDCYKKSAIDIVKNIKWNAAGFQGPKSVYFEIKPEIDCGDRANAYEALPIFNNGELDVNGVPVNYANSTGVAALNANGNAPTGVPNPTVDPNAVATRGEETENEGENASEESETKTAEKTEPKVAENKPPVDNNAQANDPAQEEKPKEETKPTTSEPVASAAKPTTTAPSSSELDKMREVAKIKDERQAGEIEKLKAEIEKMRKEKEAREAREAEEKEQARLAQERQQREEMEERRRQREDEARRRREENSRDRYASNDNDRNSGRDRYDDRRGGGYDDDRYSRDRDRRDDDRYASNEPIDPPKNDIQRKEDEKRKLEEQVRDIQNRIREMENEERRREADRKRLMQDMARAQEQSLRAGEEATQARERAELEKLELERREAEERKREQERLVQTAMDEIKRLQLDMERKMAELERFEKELSDREAQKLQIEQETAKNQELRKAEIEAQIDQIKMAAGVGATTGGSVATGGVPAVPINISANDSNALSLLVQQIAQMRADIANLQNLVARGGGVSSGSSRRTGTTKSSTRVYSANGNNAASSSSWKKTDYRNPEDKNADIYAGFNSNEGIKKANEHKNVSIGKMSEPKFAGSPQAMKKQIADKLQAGGICGLVQTTFIVTVSPKGEVIGYDITYANTTQVQLQLGPILQGLKFQSTPGTRLPSRALYEMKAEIVCEGQERINIKDVPDLINQ